MKKYTDLLSDIINFVEGQRNALQQKLDELKKAYFNERSAEIFIEHPIVESFSWRQYTPYFNDGDSCTFRSEHDEPDINEWNQYSDDLDEDDPFYEFNPDDYDPNCTYRKGPVKPEDDSFRAYAAVMNFLSTFSDEDMEELFGDHVAVTVTAAGARADWYNHD